MTYESFKCIMQAIGKRQQKLVANDKWWTEEYIWLEKAKAELRELYDRQSKVGEIND